jgi:3,4-dihydroxy 2-butanone 4-phosphate synthase/GTP cyclohydrolase II
MALQRAYLSPIPQADAVSFDPITAVIDAIRAGRMVIIADDEGRENEGDLIMAAEKATPAAVAFFVRHTSGIICMPMLPDRLEQLRLPQMVPDNTESHRTAFTISVDYKHGTTTGVSAADRARTIRALADPESQSDDFARPGHVFPLRYATGGVLTRAGHTEASIDLVRLAGLNSPAAVICEIVNDDGSMKRGADLVACAREHDLKMGTIADLIRHRFATEKSVERVADQCVRTQCGEFRLVAYEDTIGRCVHLALVRGVIDANVPTLVRVHIENTLCDVLLADSIQCHWPMRRTLERIADEGCGVAVLLRMPQAAGDTIRQMRAAWATNVAQQEDDHPQRIEDQRTIGIGSQILADLGVRQMRLLGLPRRYRGLGGFGLEIVEHISD